MLVKGATGVRTCGLPSFGFFWFALIFALLWKRILAMTDIIFNLLAPKSGCISKEIWEITDRANLLPCFPYINSACCFISSAQDEAIAMIITRTRWRTQEICCIWTHFRENLFVKLYHVVFCVLYKWNPSRVCINSAVLYRCAVR